MIKNMLNETKSITSHRYDSAANAFIKTSNSDTNTLRGLSELVNMLSKYEIQFIVDNEYNIVLNVIDKKPEKAFVVSLDKDANIIDINDIALEMSGYSRKELIGKNYFSTFIDDVDKEDISKVFFSVLSGSNNYWTHQNNIVLKDATKKLLNWSNALIKDKDSNISTIHAFGIAV